MVCRTISGAPRRCSLACWYSSFCFIISFSWGTSETQLFLCLKSPKLNTVGEHFMFLFLKQTRITHFETFHLLALMILIVVVLYVTALRVKTWNAGHGWDVSHIESMYKCTNIALIFTSLMSQPWPWCLCSTDKGCHLQAYCEHTDINFNLNLSRRKEEVA